MEENLNLNICPELAIKLATVASTIVFKIKHHKTQGTNSAHPKWCHSQFRGLWPIFPGTVEDSSGTEMSWDDLRCFPAPGLSLVFYLHIHIFMLLSLFKPHALNCKCDTHTRARTHAGLQWMMIISLCDGIRSHCNFQKHLQFPRPATLHGRIH